MKERKTKQVRIRLSESQLKKLVEYIIDHPNEFKNQSDLIRESINDKICRTQDITSKSKRKSN
jgi:Arc/MetJ-type ribon-helix-helix transcriptional regulator